MHRRGTRARRGSGPPGLHDRPTILGAVPDIPHRPTADATCAPSGSASASGTRTAAGAADDGRGLVRCTDLLGSSSTWPWAPGALFAQGPEPSRLAGGGSHGW